MDTTTQPHPHTLLTSTFDTRSGAIAEAQRRHTDAEPQLVWHFVFSDAYVVLARSVCPTFRTDGVVYSTETAEQREAARPEPSSSDCSATCALVARRGCGDPT